MSAKNYLLDRFWSEKEEELQEHKRLHAMLDELSEQKVQVVRTRSYKVYNDRVYAHVASGRIAEIVEKLFREKFTGKLSINFVQGGVASVVAEQKIPSEY